MPRSYRHISDYEIEIIEKFNNGQSLKSIAEEYGFSYKQIRNFVTVKQTSGLNVRHQSNRITTKLKETLRH